MIDVYRKNIKVEKNIFKYALFVSFFPQLVAGPIERSTSLLTQLSTIEKITFKKDNLKEGVLLVLWGMFQKTIISDRIAIVVDEIYGNYTEYGMIPIVLATIVFAIQIYCDFDGYTNIARGVAKVLGIQLMNNFRQPYFATTIHDFWDRWHISLSSWFRDYLYIPLGGNRRGKIRKYINLLIVFLISGLWHGADWTFIIWGGIHGILNVFEDMLHLNENSDSFSVKFRKRIAVFCIVDIAWLFFRADDIKHAKGLLTQMLIQMDDFSDFFACMDVSNWKVLLVSLIILFIVDYIRNQGISLIYVLQEQEIWFRWSIYIGILVMVIYMQVYSVTYEPSQFIYFQF